MNVIRASLSAVGLALVLGCANCGAGPAEDVSEAAEAVGPTVQIVVSTSDFDASGIEKVFLVPVERTLKRNKNVAHTWSTATDGAAELEVTFDVGTSEEDALSQASAAATKIADRSRGAVGAPAVTLDDDDEPMRLRLSGTDVDAMFKAGEAIAAEAGSLGGVTAATLSMEMVTDVAISLDKERLAAHGLKPMGVTGQLSKPEIQEGTDIDAILAVPIEVAGGAPLRLGDIADVQLTQVPSRLDRLDGNRVAWINIEAADADETLRVALQGLTSPDPSVRVSVDD